MSVSLSNIPPYDPVKLAEATDQIVSEGTSRRYNTFRLEPFYVQMASARGVGCNLRCNFCWINASRDDPLGYGRLYSPEEVYEKLMDVSTSRYGRGIMTEAFRITGCEPTISRDHLLSLIDVCSRKSPRHYFLLETNGILLGYDKTYIKDLAGFRDHLVVRVSLKAGTPEAFQARTAAGAEFFEYPFAALRYLKEESITHAVVSMSKDPCVMPDGERRSLLEKIAGQDYSIFRRFGEESADPFGITLERLQQGGIDISRLNKEHYAALDFDEIASEAKKMKMHPADYLRLVLFEVVKPRADFDDPWGGAAQHDLDRHLG